MLVDLLVEMYPEVYRKYVVYENVRKVLFVVVLRNMYGMLVKYLLWYKMFHSDLEYIGLEFNPYNPFPPNRMVNKKQHTLRFHVYELMILHID